MEDFVRTVTGEGVTVALGHSNATFDEAKKAVDAGASVWVHAYNGMRGLTHRELGMVGAMYQLPHTYAELICDGHHVDPKACEILIKQKGTENIALITDCMTAGDWKTEIICWENSQLSLQMELHASNRQVTWQVLSSNSKMV